MSKPEKINFITGNANKLSEVRSILSPALARHGIELTSRDVPGLVEIQAQSTEEVVRDKCRRAAAAVNGPVLVEDTCLCFNALGGLPGPYIKYFLQTLTVHSLHKLLAGFDDKSAQAVCTFAYCEGPGEGREVRLFQGRTDGTIVPARGPTDFGWDAAFEHQGRTYAEMPKAEKNQVSHRAKALVELKRWLEEEEEEEDR